MTVSSNSTKTDNKFFKYIKGLWREDRFPLLFFPFIVIGGIIGGYLDYNITNDKISYIKEHKPLLICDTMIICGSDRYKNYNMVEIDGEIKIEILDENDKYIKYIGYKHVAFVKPLK